MDELIDRVRWEAWGRRRVEDGGRGGVCEVVGGAGGVHIIVNVQVQSAKVGGWRVLVFE